MADHGQQAHPFHLVDPSPWPFVAAMVLLVFVSGGLMFMHNVPMANLVLGVGLFGVLYVMYAWWKEVIREGIYDRSHTNAVQHGLRMGMALFIVSELMFFVAFFWAFFDGAIASWIPLGDDIWQSATSGSWPPDHIKTLDAWDLPLINTLILLLSGTTVTWAHHALLTGNNRDVKRGLWLTVILGVLFTCLQVLEYSHATFGFAEGIYPSTFYMATGFHGFHVIVGTIFLAVCLVRAHRGTLTKKGHLGFEFAAWYWHFVDVVWLFLFICVYWWGG